MTDLLLARGAGVDTQSASGRTALHAACRAGQLAAARMLVDRGASLTIRDRTDRRAFEHLNEALAKGDAQWLVAASKAASKVASKAAQVLPAAAALSDAHFLS